MNETFFYGIDSLMFSKFTVFTIFTDLLNTYCRPTFIFLHSPRNSLSLNNFADNKAKRNSIL